MGALAHFCPPSSPCDTQANTEYILLLGRMSAGYHPHRRRASHNAAGPRCTEKWPCLVYLAPPTSHGHSGKARQPWKGRGQCMKTTSTPTHPFPVTCPASQLGSVPCQLWMTFIVKVIHKIWQARTLASLACTGSPPFPVTPSSA
jgi:hypothetical protein